ncbi:MAG: multidrug resistance protein D [Syntrophus sp. PtaB.Bin001]|nr:MAG: multidrug resistance protein D [Syntrophus sp. PtaB.Bin001]
MSRSAKAGPSNTGSEYAAGSGIFRALPPGIWALGFVSLLMDTSSELIHSLLPVFMSTVLGASMMTIGMVEGIAEATASITKVFSGTISDYLGKRKLLAVLGYGLAAFTKPIFPLAGAMHLVFAARFIDRIGKGIRGAPRDALVADITPRHLWGEAYGFRQSLDSVGAFLGPILAVAFMAWFANDIRTVFWVAVIPAFISVVVLIPGVHEPQHLEISSEARSRFTRSALKQLSFQYWLIVLLSAVFTLARFSEAFLILRAQDVGLALGFVPMVLIVMNIVYAASAYPAGLAADRFSRRTLLIQGLAMLIVADLILAASASPLTAFIGAGFWGLHMGLTQGLFAKLVADVAPAALRGTAFGIFNLVGGGATLLASVIAGVLWTAFGAPATFLTGAAFSLLAAIGLLAYRKRPQAAGSRKS